MINFIGLGAQKAGTSWVYACLYEHPQICAPVKEIHFFSRQRFENGKEWYENHFTNCDATKKKGEFSTSYLYSKETPLRIKETYPDVKLIAILRNPVERAISQYRNAIKAGEITEETSFEVYTQANESVIGQGMYHEQLKRYYDLFTKDQILVLIYEDIKKDPSGFMKRIYRFLGADDSFESSMLYTEINIARTPKSVGLGRVMHRAAEFLRRKGFDKMVHGIRKSGLPNLIHKVNTKNSNPAENIDTSGLAGHFLADVEQLGELLNRDLKAEWKLL